MVALLVAVASLQAPTLDDKITLTCRAERAEVLLKDLSDKTHIQFETTSLTRDEILVLSVREKPVREVMAKIAQVTDAIWVKDQSIYRLVRPVENKIAEQKRHENLRRQFFTAALAHLREEAKGKDTTPINRTVAQNAANDYVELAQQYLANRTGRPPARIYAIQNESPNARLSRRIIGSIDVPTLMSATEGHRTVFALNPNHLQRPLGIDPKVLDAYEREQAVWADAAGPILAGANLRGTVGDVDFKPPSPNASKILVAFSDNPLPRITISIVDAIGNRVGGSDVYLSEDDPPPPGPTNAKAGSIKVEYGAVSQYLLKLRRNPYQAGTDVQSAPADVREQLANPMRFDPDSFTDTDILFSYARAKDQNLIACLPDSYWTQRPTIPADDPNFLAAWFKSTVNEGSGWVTLTPRDPVVCRRDRADRRALQDFVQSMVRDGRTSLAAQGAFFSKASPECRSSLTDLYRTVFDQPAYGGGFRSNDIRLFGLMTSGQLDTARQLAESKQPLHLEIGSLDARQKEAISRLIFDCEIFLYPIIIEDGIVAAPASLQIEATERLPDGLRSDGILDIAFQTQEGAVPMKGDDRDFQAYTAKMIGSWIAHAEAPGVNALWRGTKREDIATVRYGHNDRWTFTIRPMPSSRAPFQLEDEMIGKPIPWNDVPESFRNEVERYVKQVKETLAKPPRN